MMRSVQTRNSSAEQGFAFIVAVLLVVLVGGLGLALLTDATTESRASGNYRQSAQAFYSAKAGLEEARVRIPASSTNAIALPATLTDVTYIVSDAGVDPTSPANPYYDAEYGAEFPGVTPVVSPLVTTVRPTDSALYYQWVRITRKTEASSSQDIDRDGTLTTQTAVFFDGVGQNLTGGGRPVYKITALAALPNGGRSLLQMEGSNVPPFSSGAAITTQDEVRMVGSFSVSGEDYCGQSATQYGVVSTADININGNSGTITGTTGPSPNETGTYENAPVTYNIVTLINSLKPYGTPIQQVDNTVIYQSSTQSYKGTNAILGVPPNQPPQSGDNGTPVITYVGANLELSSNNSQGAGILIVDGDLNVNGGLYYYGLVVVRGTVSFTGGGSGSMNIYGAIVAGSSMMNSNVLGGGINVQYDSCAVQSPYNTLPVRVLAVRELINY